MTQVLEVARTEILDALDEISRSLEQAAAIEKTPGSLALVLATTLSAEWIALRRRGGEWLEVRSGAIREGPPAELVARRLDFALLAELPRGRLIRLYGSALERRPRFAGSGIREIAVYVDRDGGSAPGFVAIALPEQRSVDPHVLEFVLRSLFSLEILGIRSGQAGESERMASAGRQAACALHDLRHELTVAELELERAACAPGLDPGEGLDRVASALAAARSICEHSLSFDSTQVPGPCRAVGVLRGEAFAACAVAGRGDAVRVEIRCPDGLVIFTLREPLARLVRNLVLNAVENSPDGERVIVEMEPESSGDLVLRVIDRGRGMSSSERGELLRFGRSGRGSSGIGTASIEACARTLDASIRIESRVGDGTLAEIRFPRKSNWVGT